MASKNINVLAQLRTTHCPRECYEAVAELIVASDNYYKNYCQDEADIDGPRVTGCSQSQSDEAARLRDALARVLAMSANYCA